MAARSCRLPGQKELWLNTASEAYVRCSNVQQRVALFVHTVDSSSMAYENLSGGDLS